jgi:predicted nucleic acid-binding protein
MTAALLDTSVVIALAQEGRGIDLTEYDRVAVSALTYAELRLGVAMARTDKMTRRRYAALETVEDVFGPGLPFDDRAAMFYGRITAAIAERSGDPKANRTDRMIAAIAAANGLALVTVNAGDVKGLGKIVRVIDLAERA